MAIMIATAIKGFLVKSTKVDELPAFCSQAGINHRGKSKRTVAPWIARTKQMDSVIKLTGAAAKLTTQQTINTQLRILSACFTDQRCEEFVSVNKRKTKPKLTQDWRETAKTAPAASQQWSATRRRTTLLTCSICL